MRWIYAEQSNKQTNEEQRDGGDLGGGVDRREKSHFHPQDESRHFERVYNFPCDGVQTKEAKVAAVVLLASSISLTFPSFIPFAHKCLPERQTDFV